MSLSLQLQSTRAQPLTSKVTGGMRERRWGDSGPSCSKALTCGYKCTKPLRLGGEEKAASLGQSKGAQSAFSEQRGDQRDAKRSCRTPPPSTLSSIEDSRLVSWLSLVTMLIGLASPGTWEMRKQAKKDTVTEDLSLRGVTLSTFQASSHFIPLTTPGVLLLSPFADEEIKDVPNHLKCIMAKKNKSFFSSL